MGVKLVKSGDGDEDCLNAVTKKYKKCTGSCWGKGPESMDSKVCQENCDKKAAAAKKECGDDKACLEKVMNDYKKCSAGCKVSYLS